jgi:hypothetical protein
MIPLLINIVGFYLGWFACVLGAAKGYWALGPITVLLLLVVHLKLHRPRRAELALAGIAFLLGLIADSGLTFSGIMVPQRDFMPAGFTTFWMTCMWVNFALTLNVALKCLYSRPWIAALLGLLGGPAAYYTGARLGAINIPDPLWTHLAVIGAAWAVVTPWLVWCAQRLKQRLSLSTDSKAERRRRFLEGGVGLHEAESICWSGADDPADMVLPEGCSEENCGLDQNRSGDRIKGERS